LIAKHLPSNRATKVLDLGCGSGTLLHFLREAGYKHVIGVDLSAEQVACALALNIEGVRQGDLFDELSVTGDETWDVVATLDVIEHMTKSELLKFAGEVYRVLKPRGRWLIHVPNAEALFGSRIRYADWTHEQAFTKESIEQMARVVGFNVVQCYEDQPIVHGLKSALRWLLWKMARGVLRLYWVAETGALGQDCLFSQNLLAVARKR
jgi:cyclopropane fatty-acyl-phospholipid synthase-like methyltransferase